MLDLMLGESMVVVISDVKEVRMAVSTSVLRRLNLRALLRHAFVVENFTAAEAMAATGLTRGTVLGLCDEVADACWLGGTEGRRVAGNVSRARRATPPGPR